MSESDSWSDHDDVADTKHARVVADQMRAATSSLRARLSIVREAQKDAGQPPRRS